MSTRDEIRAAMERLLSGTSQYTNGRLTRTNLALEAGIGRATLYRQPDLISEWNRRIADADANEMPPNTEALVARLTRQLGEERQRRADAELVAQGLALAVAELYWQLEDRDGNDAAKRVIEVARRSR